MKDQKKTTVGEEIVRQLGMNPGSNVSADQRLQLLRSWHSEPKEIETKDQRITRKPHS